ncbi:sister chromatid separation protein-like protein [Eremomyces bilateralis CBS 781.70]|uniref:Sister chromatid separation protein-like protein n=1 Tax=Eremomyces bilateralis CBS 781.70 TaxID=1392243 RepID=A0A6G1FYP1_9PEZI|nr:sister chromatid separation protein-like protein [Eremomyces bilateralis CBS 781.70]KAF1810820.1 sister chromatid separation protein-like protein [Eremomyces bilateralis CBS 781.70]
MADEYLSPSFDPSKLTVPQIRGILVEHNVQYPSGALKPQLVELFKSNVTPQAGKILKSRQTAKRSSKGIIDVPSSQASTADDDELGEMLPPPKPSPATRTSRRTTRSSAEPDTLEPAGKTPGKTPRKTPGKTPGKRPSSKHARSETESEVEKPKQRRTRKSEVPNVKTEDPEPDMWSKLGDDSPFSAENPFQSGGSSPPSAPRTASRSRTRKTLDGEQRAKRKSSGDKRRVTTPALPFHEDGYSVPTRTTFEMPVPRVKNRKSEPVVEAGEEFTPEETLDLVKAESESPQLRVARRPRERSTSSTAGGLSILTIFLALFAGLFHLWREEKMQVGYCGIGKEPATELAGVHVPEAVRENLLHCEPCPHHALCYENLETTCEKGFVLKPHPLSLGGLVPIPPSCEPDGLQARKVKAVADRAVEVMRERNAAFECGELVDEQGKHQKSPEISEEELKKEVSRMRKKRGGMSDAEFDDLFSGAIPEILSRDEIAVGTDGTKGRTLSSNSLARLPVSCAARRWFRQQVARHLLKVVIFLLTVSSGFYARHRVQYQKNVEAKAKQLARVAMDRLANQASLNAYDERAHPDAYLSMVQLRDDLLRDEFSATRRGKLWEKVQKKVENNSNVRPTTKETRHGDISKVWEWTGAIEDARNTEKRASGRFSLGPLEGRSSRNESPSVHWEDQTNGAPAEARRWDEGRPIY